MISWASRRQGDRQLDRLAPAGYGARPLQAGDELVLSVNFDVAFLMGYRITWSDDE